MSTTNQPAWIRKLQILYGITLGLWLVSTVVVVLAATKTGDWSGIGILAAFAPGLIYFAYTSFNFSRQTDDARITSRERLFTIQSWTGKPALVGAVLGFLPAAVNIPSYYTMAPIDQQGNAGMILPWQMVYIFTVTYLIAAAIRRGLKNEARAAAAANTPAQDPVATETAATPSEQPTAARNAGNEPKAVEIRKTPIAPNVFFGAAILLALFTFQVEATAFDMARHGELTNLQTPGMAFSFFQFIDLIVGNAAGLAIVIFGIINWQRDGVAVRRILTPVLAAISLAIVPGNIGMSLAGATGLTDDTEQRVADAQASWAWISVIAEGSPPEGFEQMDGVVDCGSDPLMCDDPDSSVTFTRVGAHESEAEFVCATVVAWAHDTGAGWYSTAPDYVDVSLPAGDDEAAVASCVMELTTPDTIANATETYSPVFRFVGESNTESPYTIDLQEIRWGNQSTDPGARNYVVTVTTTYQPDEVLPGQDQLTDGTHELNDLLTAIGQARLANPDTDPNDAELIRGALATYPYDIPVTPLVEADGSVWFIEIQQSDEPEPMCVAVPPYDEEFEGLPDPGTGYGVSQEDSIENLKANARFGAVAWGSCAD